jgi:voltage-gated potassium channel
MSWANATINSHRRAALRCIGAIVIVVMSGTLGFWLLEPEWGVWRSLYFTLITVTTVGYGDEGISPQGEKFAALLLIVGIATFTFSLSTLVQIATNREAIRKRKMQKQIDQTKDHVLVCGYGRMGQSVCNELDLDKIDTVVIDKDSEKCRQAVGEGRLVLHGSAGDDDLLLRAGIERARGIICALNCDAENMLITITAREFGQNIFIACCAKVKSTARKLERAGASLVVLPYEMAGSSIARSIVNPHLAKVLHRQRHCQKSIQLGEVSVCNQSPLVNQTIAGFGASEQSIVFVAIHRSSGDILLRPSGEDIFCPGDIVIVAGRPGDLNRMHEAAQPALALSV